MSMISNFLAWLERQQSFPDLTAVSKLRKLQLLKTTHFNSFDIDGVIMINKEIGGVHPGPNDVIITGRSVEESKETYRMLEARGIWNLVFFNPLPFSQKTRETSGQHKANILNGLLGHGFTVGCHFEDDEVQKAEIERLCPRVPVIHLVHNLTTKENVRHDD